MCTCYRVSLFTVAALLGLAIHLGDENRALGEDALPTFQPPQGERLSREGAWESWHVDGLTLSRRVIQLVAKSEAQPALSTQLIPNRFQRKDGNAAVHYLQAMGFLEQSYSLKRKLEFELENSERARAEGVSVMELPPHVWRETRPQDLPIEEVQQYLARTSFQPHYLALAAQYRQCDFNRNIREVENPVGFLLPEVQSMRGLARLQSLRFLLAMAEDRPHDAVAIFGQQLAMAAHLSDDPFVVSALVGLACANIGWADAFYLCEHPEAPNLYWAIATLPSPLVDMSLAMSYERELLFEQFKPLRDVDLTPRSALYWSRFVDDYFDFMNEYHSSTGIGSERTEAEWTLAIAAGYPGAKRYLHEVEKIEIAGLDSLPNTQVFFLAVKKLYERQRDELFKLTVLPAWKRAELGQRANENFRQDSREFGFIAQPSDLFLPAVQAAMSAQTRSQQSLALLQTVEAIRHHLAMNDNALPQTLDQLELPAPVDPGTGKPFSYQRHDQGATLTGSPHPGLQYQFELRVN